MVKKEIVLVGCLLILAGIWRFIFWSPDVFGTDVMYHYTIVEQAIANGKPSNDNNLALCYEGVKKSNHPLGFYVLPYIFGKIIGLEKTFIMLPILLGLASLFLWYLFARKIWNKKVAMIALFFLAISLAHITKSFSFSYRGENIVYPLLIGSLLCMYYALFENKKFAAVGCGVISGITAWFWNGYMLVMILVLATIILCLFYRYLKKEKEMEKNVVNAGLIVGSQAITFYSIFFNYNFWGKGLVFGQVHYPLIMAGIVLLLTALFISIKKKSQAPLIIAVLLGLSLAFIFIPEIKEILQGFGSIKPENVWVTPELTKTPWYLYLLHFHLLLITSSIGIYYFFKRFDSKKTLFLGLLIASFYLVMNALRYIYVAAIPIITLTAVCLDNQKKIGKKFDIFTFLTITLLIFMVAYSIYAIPAYYTEELRFRETEPYAFLKNYAEKDACVMELSFRGATIEYFTKRYYFFHSLGINEERNRRAAEVLMKNDVSNLNMTHFYILTNYADLRTINIWNNFTGLDDIGFYRMGVSLGEDEVNETDIREQLDYMRYIFVNEKLFINSTGKGCAYVAKKDVFYLKNGVCDTPLFKMITNQSINHFTNIYFKDGFAVYRYVAE